MSKLLLIILLSKVIIFGIILLSFNFLPFNKTNYLLSFQYPKNENTSVFTAFKTWDGQHYLYLIENGYVKNNISNAFYPLFPAISATLNKVINNSFISGLIISNLFSALGLMYFYSFLKILFKNKILEFKILLLLICFPTAFYLSLIYSESSFFFLVSAFFYYLYSKKYFIASVFALLLSLSRPMGIFIIFPYITFWMHINKTISKNYFEKILILFKNKQTYYLLAPLLGFAIYLVIMKITTGDYFEGFKMAGLFLSQWHISNIFNPSLFFVNLFFPDNIQIHGFDNSIIDRIFFLCYLVLLYFIYKKLNKTLFMYSLFMGMVPVFGSFMSYSRYLLLVFPIFIIMAKIFTSNKYKILYYPILLIFILMQIVFIAMHALNYWVA